MNLIQRMNARLVGWRVYLLAVLLAVPDILNGLAGVDFATLWPNSGVKVSLYLTIARVAAIPIILNLRRAARGEDCAKEPG